MAAKVSIEGAKTETVLNVPPESVQVVTDQADPLFDDGATVKLDENKVKHAVVYGINQRVLVRKRGDQYVVVTGRKRARALVEANRRRVEAGQEPWLLPIEVERVDDQAGMDLMFEENHLRAEMSPLKQARDVQRWMQAAKKDEKDAAVFFGVSIGTIRNRLSVLGLAPEVVKLIEDETLTTTAGLALKDLPAERQAEEAKRLATENAASGNGAAPGKRGKGKGKGRATPGVRHGKTRIESVAAAGGLSEPVEAALLWAAQVITDDEACKVIKGFDEALKKSKQRKGD